MSYDGFHLTDNIASILATLKNGSGKTPHTGMSEVRPVCLATRGWRLGGVYAFFFEAGGFCGHIRLHPFPAKNKGFGLIVRLGKVFHVGLDLSLIIGVRLVGIQLGKS